MLIQTIKFLHQFENLFLNEPTGVVYLENYDLGELLEIYADQYDNDTPKAPFLKSTTAISGVLKTFYNQKIDLKNDHENHIYEFCYTVKRIWSLQKAMRFYLIHIAKLLSNTVNKCQDTRCYPSPSPKESPSVTPSITVSPTATPSASQIQSPTPTPSVTPTPFRSVSPTPTPTFKNPNSNPNTNSNTHKNSYKSPSRTPSVTPSISVSRSVSSTQTPTPNYKKFNANTNPNKNPKSKQVSAFKPNKNTFTHSN